MTETELILMKVLAGGSMDEYIVVKKSAGRSPVNATSFLHKLKREGFVSTDGNMCTLTDKGRQALVLCALSAEGQTAAELEEKTGLQLIQIVDAITFLKGDGKVVNGDPRMAGAGEICTYKLKDPAKK